MTINKELIEHCTENYSLTKQEAKDEMIQELAKAVLNQEKVNITLDESISQLNKEVAELKERLQPAETKPAPRRTTTKK